jgi:dTDP-4-amino-4,6-dideoxygalactose transaminase
VLAQKLRFLDAWNEERRAIATEYRDRLFGMGDLVLPPVPENSKPVWHVFPVRTADPGALGDFLRFAGIASGRHYPQPVHLSPAYEWLGYGPGSFPVTETLSRELISLPIFPGMTEAQIDAVVGRIRRYFEHG